MKPTAPSPARKAKPTTPAAPPLPNFALIPARPFPKNAVTSPEGFHELGPVVAPSNQARANHADSPPHQIAAAASQALAALTGSGPRQTQPHSDTAIVLGEALDRLRDHALDGDTDAFHWLAHTLHKGVADFHEVARRNPANAAAWGERQALLPVLVPRKIAASAKKTTALHLELAKTFDLFQLGEKCPLRVNPKSGARALGAGTPVNVLAAGLLRHLADHRALAGLLRPPVPRWAQLAAVLPDSDCETAAADWGEAAWELLRSTFENDKELVNYCDLGEARKNDTKGEGVGAQISEIRRRLLRAVNTLVTDSN